MDECMKMPGGGPWEIAPGQITDDSELAMCLLQAITTSIQQSGKFGFQNGECMLLTVEIGKNYRNWLKSQPFDIGI